MPTKTVSLTHPDSTTTIEVDEDQAPMYAKQGWRTKAKPAPKK